MFLCKTKNENEIDGGRERKSYIFKKKEKEREERKVNLKNCYWNPWNEQTIKSILAIIINFFMKKMFSTTTIIFVNHTTVDLLLLVVEEKKKRS